MSTIAERTFVINTQAVGTVELTATLETANASLASYITENRTYLDGVRTSIDSDLATLTAEAATTRGSAYNKDFGTAAGTVAEGNHLHDDRYYTKGSVDNLLDNYQFKIAPESGFNLPIGTTANTLAAGNDPRFSDAREPTEHLHTKAVITDFNDDDYATAAQGLLADSAMQPEDVEERYYPRSAINVLLGQLEPRFNKNTGFNLQLGTTLGTVAEGQHTHTHFPNAVTVSETTHASSPLNTLTSKNYVDEKVRQLLESEGFVFKHNEMLFLDGDDHLQYHTDARGDARYPLITSTDANFISVNSRIDAQNPRFDTLQSDLDQAYVDINQERTDRTFAQSVLRQELEENIQDVDDAAVHILGDQVIDGEKKFTGNVIVEGEAILQNVTIKSQSELDVGDAIVLLNAGETGTPSVDAGFEIERGTQANAQLLFDESTDQWVAGIVGALKALASENYVDDNFVGLTGDQTIAGEKTFDNAIFANTIVPKDAPNLFTNAPWQYASALRYTDFPVNQLPNVQYVKDNFLSLDGGTLTDDFVIDKENNLPSIFLRGGGTSQGSITSGANSIRLRQLVGSVLGTDLQLFATYGNITKELRGPDPSTATGYTPRQYVEEHFLSTTDTDVQSVAGAVVFAEYLTAQGVLQVNDWLQSSFEAVRFAKPARALNSQTGTPNNLDYLTKEFVDDNFLSLDGGTLTDDLEIEATSGDSKIRLKDDDGSYFDLVSSSGVTSLERFNTGNTKTNQLRINDTYTLTSQELRGPDPVDNAAYTPKLWVEDNFLSLDGGTLTDNLNIKRPSGQTTLRIDSDIIPALQFSINDAEKAIIFAESSRLRLRYENGSADTYLNMYADYISVNKELRGLDPTNDAGFTPKKYVEDNFVNKVSTLIQVMKTTNLEINSGGTSDRVTVNSTGTGSAQFRLNKDSKIAGLLYSANDVVYLRQYNDPDTFGVGSQIACSDGNVSVTHGDLRSNNMGNIGTSVTTKSYVEDNFLSLDGGTVIGAAQFAGDFRVRRSAAAAQPGRIDLFTESDNKGMEIYALDDRSILRHHASADASYHDINIYNDYVEIQRELRVSGDTTLTNTGVATRMQFHSDVGETALIEMFSGGVEKSSWNTFETSTSIGFNGGAFMTMRGSFGDFTHEMKGVDPTTATGLVTRQYAEDNFLGFHGGSLTDIFRLKKENGTDLVINIQTDGDKANVIQFYTNNVRTGKITVTDGGFSLHRIAADNSFRAGLSLYNDNAAISRELLAPSTTSSSDPTSLVTKDYIDDFYTPSDATASGAIKLKEATNNGSGNVLLKAPDSIPTSYSVTMPASRGNVGDVLVCVSVTPSTMTMAWQAP